MLHLPETIILPLKTDAEGRIRVSGTRVTLHTLLTAYKRGDSPEAIHIGFPSVPLADIYAVIGYYLAHQVALDAYLRDIDAEADRIRQEWEARYTPEQRARSDEFRRLLAEKHKSDHT